MKINRHTILLSSTLLLLIISGCQPASTSTDNPQPNITTGGEEVQNIQVGKAPPRRSVSSSEEFPLPNCGGTEKLTQTLGTQVSVSKSVQMGNTITLSGGGEIGVSAAAKLTVQAAIEAEYKQEYETANSRLDTIGMGAAPKTHVIYMVEWEKQEFSSVVTYELNRELVQTPYTFIMNIPKLSGSREEICPDIGSVVGTTPFFSPEYDNFNDPLYNDSINNDLWKRFQDLNCDVKQDKGVVIFKLSKLSPENTLCYLNVPENVEMNKVGAMEAKILTKKGAAGDYSIGILEFVTNGFSADTIWITQCGIRQSSSENKVELFFNVDNSYPSSSPEIYQTTPALPDQWYKMRLEIIPETGTVLCYVNDKVLGSHKPTNVDTLKPQLFTRHILGFWSPQSNSIFQMDDVTLVSP